MLCPQLVVALDQIDARVRLWIATLPTRPALRLGPTRPEDQVGSKLVANMPRIARKDSIQVPLGLRPFSFSRSERPRKVGTFTKSAGTQWGHNKVFLAAPRTPSSASVFLRFVRVTFSYPAFTAVTHIRISAKFSRLVASRAVSVVRCRRSYQFLDEASSTDERCNGLLKFATRTKSKA